MINESSRSAVLTCMAVIVGSPWYTTWGIGWLAADVVGCCSSGWLALSKTDLKYNSLRADTIFVYISKLRQPKVDLHRSP